MRNESVIYAADTEKNKKHTDYGFKQRLVILKNYYCPSKKYVVSEFGSIFNETHVRKQTIVINATGFRFHSGAYLYT